MKARRSVASLAALDRLCTTVQCKEQAESVAYRRLVANQMK
jgi:hypothetical protein